MRLYSFEWQTTAVNGAGDWHIKARTWRTALGAEKAASKWVADMAAEDCAVVVRLGYIEDNHFHVLTPSKIGGKP